MESNWSLLDKRSRHGVQKVTIADICILLYKADMSKNAEVKESAMQLVEALMQVIPCPEC